MGRCRGVEVSSGVSPFISCRSSMPPPRHLETLAPRHLPVDTLPSQHLPFPMALNVRAALIQARCPFDGDPRTPLDRIKKDAIEKHLSLIEAAAKGGAQV